MHQQSQACQNPSAQGGVASSKAVACRYLFNKYRVLLTRAREGMVLWLPPGDPSDPTRQPALLDATATFLGAAGVPML
jgi:hypothetical protein